MVAVSLGCGIGRGDRRGDAQGVGAALGGPIESADLGGLDTLWKFAEALQPHLDARRDPPEEVGALVAAGHRGIASGRGVYDWTKRDGAALLAKRRAELFRWLKVDRDEAE
jgi:3-hydroxybutyryl-CoA dehydrogenase